jgi:hypothetical protein
MPPEGIKRRRDPKGRILPGGPYFAKHWEMFRPGTRLGHWEIIAFSGKRHGKRAHYRCLCHGCGKTKEVWEANLRSGHSLGCGCERNRRYSMRLKAAHQILRALEAERIDTQLSSKDGTRKP